MDQVFSYSKSFYGFLISSAIDIVVAIVIFVIGYVVAKAVRTFIRKRFDKSKKLDVTLKPITSSLAFYAILVLSAIAASGRLGIEITSLIALVGAAGLAVGLALQGTLQNVAAGFMILILRPFKAGDYIEGGGTAGTVEAIELFSTTLKTAQGLYVYVPSSQLFNTCITNYTRNGIRRNEINFGISYSDDIGKAITTLKKLANSDSRVLADQEVVVYVTDLADSSVNLQLRCWTSVDDYWLANFDLREKGKVSLEKAGCSIPFPQRDIHMITK